MKITKIEDIIPGIKQAFGPEFQIGCSPDLGDYFREKYPTEKMGLLEIWITPRYSETFELVVLRQDEITEAWLAAPYEQLWAFGDGRFETFLVRRDYARETT